MMRAEGTRGYTKKRRVRTTVPEPSATPPQPAPVDFTAAATSPNLPLAEGMSLYLATVIDCYFPRLAGWAVADHMCTELLFAGR